jgi:formate dehydrogenase subunit gamma
VTAETQISPSAVHDLVADLLNEPGALLPILHRLQEHYGYIPSETVGIVAKALQLTRAEVHGVVTFYHDFRKVPPGAHIIKLCQAEACQAMGSADLARHAQRRLGVKLGTTSADGRYTLEPIYCLGNCALSPAALVDGTPVGRVSPKRFDALIAELGGSR